MYGKWPKVKKAESPDLINWENLHVTRAGRCIRIFAISLVTIILVVLSFGFIVYAKSIEREAKEFSPAINCPDELVTIEEAQDD